MWPQSYNRLSAEPVRGAAVSSCLASGIQGWRIFCNTHCCALWGCWRWNGAPACQSVSPLRVLWPCRGTASWSIRPKNLLEKPKWIKVSQNFIMDHSRWGACQVFFANGCLHSEGIEWGSSIVQLHLTVRRQDQKCRCWQEALSFFSSFFWKEKYSNGKILFAHNKWHYNFFTKET